MARLPKDEAAAIRGARGEGWPPTAEQLEQWADTDDAHTMEHDCMGLQCRRESEELQAFLRDPRLREALALYEAVKWIEENRRVGVGRYSEWLVTAGMDSSDPWGVTAHAYGKTLPEAVSALKSRLTPKEDGERG